MADELDDEPWDLDHTVIVGPYTGLAAAEAALRAVLGELERTVYAAHQRGANIARLYAVGDTAWISAGADVVAALAGAHEQPSIFGVDVEYEDSGNAVTEVYPVALRVDGNDLLRTKALGSHPDDRDALDAILDWEIRTAATSIGQPREPDTEADAWLFYSD